MVRLRQQHDISIIHHNSPKKEMIKSIRLLVVFIWHTGKEEILTWKLSQGEPGRKLIPPIGKSIK